MEHIEALSEEQYNEPKNKEKKTQSQIIVGLTSDMSLFYDEQGVTYAKIKVNKHYEVWPIRSKDFKHILTIRYVNLSEDKDKAPGSQAMEDALRVLEAKAKIFGKKRKVHVRVGEYRDRIYLDLCNSNWQVVEINKDGWKVIDESPILFKRSSTMQSLPTPQEGSIDELRNFINYKSEDDFKLIIAWLLSTFKANAPFPILMIQGEQGSAKSTTTKVLRALVDPSSLEVRNLPKDERDLSIAANKIWILAFDNLSGLSNQMSDSLCKVSTGGGLATRKLYSDDEEAVFNIKRPQILNGIEDIAKRQDLLDRSIVINLPPIDEKNRTDEKTFWETFEKSKAGILGALCSIVSGAIKNLPNTKLYQKPRMADFALFITAAEEYLNWNEGEFIDIYTRNRILAVDQGIESDPFAIAILELLKRKNEWVGNATQLILETRKYTDEQTIRTRAWPTPRSVRNHLRRINPALKKKGILYVEWENRKYKTLRLETIGEIP